MRETEITSIIKIIDISLLIWIFIHGALATVEALINLGMFRTSPCQAYDIGCHGPFDLIVISIPRLFYLIPLCLISYSGLVITFFRDWLPSWIFVIFSILLLALLYRYGNYGMTNLMYLFMPYLVFRAIFIYQGQAWCGITLELITRAILENYIRILLFITLLVSVTIFFPPLIDSSFIEIINCEKYYPDCSERRLIKSSNLYQALYLIPIIVLSFIGLYMNERRSMLKDKERQES